MGVVIQEFELKPEGPPRAEAPSSTVTEAQPKAFTPLDLERRQQALRDRTLRLFAH